MQMRKTLLALITSIPMLAAAPAPAEKLDPTLFAALLNTARSYAADRTLVFYCLRKNDEMTPFAYAGVHLDIAYALQLLRTSGADEHQRAELIEAVLRPIRFAKREDEDAALERQCVTAEVEKNLALLKGVGAPLFMRPPFEKLKP
jgi:hypothetical protein